VAWECVLSNACFTSFEFDLGRLAERSASSSCLVLEDQSTAAAAADDDDDDDDDQLASTAFLGLGQLGFRSLLDFACSA